LAVSNIRKFFAPQANDTARIEWRDGHFPRRGEDRLAGGNIGLDIGLMELL
jgi:hypothetical protein